MNTIVAAVKADTYQPTAIQSALTEAMDILGGWERYFQPGDRVLIKPNLLEALPPEKAVTTHPEVLRAVILGVRSVGAIPIVGDSPAAQSTLNVAEKCGILRICREEKAPLLTFARAIPVSCPDGKIVKKLMLAEEALAADKVISLAKMKTHAFMGVTGAVKNLFGCFVGTDKAQFHLRMQKHADFARMLVDLYQVIQPTLHIIDGVVGMEGKGPRNGNPIECKLLLAGVNGFAVDLVMADRMGFSAEQLPVAAAALAAGCSPRLAEVTVTGSGKDLSYRFLRPANFTSLQDSLPRWLLQFGRRQFTARPIISEQCVACGRCAKHCPPRVITMSPDRAVIDDARCIRCYCCQELCPADAVALRDGFLLRLGKRIHRHLRNAPRT